MRDTASDSVSGDERTVAAFGIVQVMGAALLWATVGVATRLVTSAGTVPPEFLGLARMALGGPVIVLLLLFLTKFPLRVLMQLDARWLAAFAMGCAVFQVCLFQSFVTLGVTVTVFITVCLPPILGTALSFAKGGQRLSGGALVAMALAVLGLLVFTAGDLIDGGESTTVRGLAVACLASAAFLMMTTASRKLTQAAGPLAVAGAGLSLSALVLLAMLPLIGIEASPEAGEWDWSLIGLILYLGLGPTALAYVLYCSGMARCRSANLGLIASMVEPAFAAALAWLLLNEHLTASEAAGCAIVMLAMVILCESERRAA